jgi:hypothetical protein
MPKGRGFTLDLDTPVQLYFERELLSYHGLSCSFLPTVTDQLYFGNTALNPIEMLWRHFRREVTPCELFQAKSALLAAAQDYFDRSNRAILRIARRP